MKQVVTIRGTALVTTSNLSRMEARHRELDEKIRELGRRSHPTPRELELTAELKKQKLLAKDQIAKLRSTS